MEVADFFRLCLYLIQSLVSLACVILVSYDVHWYQVLSTFPHKEKALIR